MDVVDTDSEMSGRADCRPKVIVIGNDNKLGVCPRVRNKDGISGQHGVHELLLRLHECIVNFYLAGISGAAPSSQ